MKLKFYCILLFLRTIIIRLEAAAQLSIGTRRIRKGREQVLKTKEKGETGKENTRPPWQPLRVPAAAAV
jgi:hypothetical protein